ncbi:Ribosomal protein S24/S35 mitochondrial conserved domain [Arabidopsis suecica]|uniref:Ribosomal protein S24/S35 mitochondrial conserved domain n=1 Tax=Arabidopsis suecica TaxID=45249 RepID=A0A8T2BEQ1_ARASU|nr:Ribosomal protein S24/S35 mitochondrial conserved domain [Arabidopsis suecica]
MRGALFRNASLCARRFILSPRITHQIPPNVPFLAPIPSPAPLKFRFFSSESDSSGENSTTAPDSSPTESSDTKDLVVEDVSNKELKSRIEKYFNEGNEDALPGVIEALLQRRLADKHAETDDELLEKIETLPFKDDVKDEDFESDFEEAHSTDEELEDLYNSPEYVAEKMRKNEFFNMDDKKWDHMIREGIQHGCLTDTKECEEILEDMLKWDQLLPDDLKKKVEAKFNELGDMCERGELEAEAAYELFKEFEDEMVIQYGDQMEAEGPPQFGEADASDRNTDLDDPPGKGPILRWQSRIVFAPGGDAWHPKNRKVKMSVTVKELGLSKHQAKRLRELVGKRYHSGKDELTITSERFEHREENRKDCLRTLYGLIEEAGKANKIAEDIRTSYVKQRLRANPAFMQKLQAKIIRSKESDAINA